MKAVQGAIPGDGVKPATSARIAPLVYKVAGIYQRLRPIPRKAVVCGLWGVFVGELVDKLLGLRLSATFRFRVLHESGAFGIVKIAPPPPRRIMVFEVGGNLGGCGCENREPLRVVFLAEL